MKPGDQHIITSVTDDRLEIAIERRFAAPASTVEDVLQIELRRHDKGKTIPVDKPLHLNHDSARVLFGLLGQFLHAFPGD